MTSFDPKSSLIRATVCELAKSAASEREMATLIFNALAAAEIDWRSVHRDDVKDLLVEALRARRRARHAEHVAT